MSPDPDTCPWPIEEIAAVTTDRQIVKSKGVNEKTRLLIVGGGRVNGESMFPGPSNGETLGEL